MDRIHGARKHLPEGRPTEVPLRPLILESWSRSRAAGVAREPERFQLRRVADDDLQQRLAANAALLTIAKPHLEWASTSLGQLPHVIYLTDREGVILHATGSQAQQGDLGLAPGFDWSDRALGTSGAGTALAANQPVEVVGPEQFNSWLHELHCTAAPVHAADGAVIGAVALRTSLAEGNPERLAWIAYLARVIDRELACREEAARERGYLQQALLESEQRHRVISQLTSDFTYTLRVDADGTLTLESVSEGFTAILGYMLEEVNARGGWEAVILAEDRPVARSSVEKLLAGASDTSEIRTVAKGGEVCWLRYLSRPVWDAGLDRVVRIEGAAQDISERKRLEEEVRLRMEQLTEANRRKDEFLSLLSHELRNPLASVRHGLQVMSQLGKEDTPAEQVRAVLERQVRHLSRLVDDLLDVSRISLGAIHLRKERVSLAALVQEAVEISRPLIEARRHPLEVSLPPHHVWLEADPVRLVQVLTNLLHNAAQYSEEGGRIWVRAGREGSEAVLRVRDKGLGISAEQLPHLFEPFQAASRRPGQSPGGLGVGLSLVRRLVDLHGGAVEASSPGSGQGSELVVRLPLTGAEQPGESLLKAPEAVRSVPSIPKRRILVVDDDRDAARMVAAFLRLEGHEVRVASSGPKALVMVEEELPEVILLDIGMPGMDGYEVTQHLRAAPAFKDVLLVALTGYGQEEDRRRCQEAGFDGHLVKPVEPDVLKQLLAQGKSGDVIGPSEAAGAR